MYELKKPWLKTEIGDYTREWEDNAREHTSFLSVEKHSIKRNKILSDKDTRYGECDSLKQIK